MQLEGASDCVRVSVVQLEGNVPPQFALARQQQSRVCAFLRPAACLTTAQMDTLHRLHGCPSQLNTPSCSAEDASVSDAHTPGSRRASYFGKSQGTKPQLGKLSGTSHTSVGPLAEGLSRPSPPAPVDDSIRLGRLSPPEGQAASNGSTAGHQHAFIKTGVVAAPAMAAEGQRRAPPPPTDT